MVTTLVKNYNIQHLKESEKANQRILLVKKKRNNIIEKETHLSFQNSESVDYDKFKKYLVEKDINSTKKH